MGRPQLETGNQCPASQYRYNLYLQLGIVAGVRSPGLRVLSLAGMLLMGFAAHLLREPDGISPVINGYLLYLGINTVTLFMSGKYKVEGNLGLLVKIKKLFSS